MFIVPQQNHGYSKNQVYLHECPFLNIIKKRPLTKVYLYMIIEVMRKTEFSKNTDRKPSHKSLILSQSGNW